MGSALVNKTTALKTADSVIRVSPNSKALGSGREERGREIRPECRGKVGSAVLLDDSLATAEPFGEGICNTDTVGMNRSEEVQTAAGWKAKDMKR